jgi:lipopolysaccharide/colanic/teichoic acid biosynthesis glycosyltransferase
MRRASLTRQQRAIKRMLDFIAGTLALMIALRAALIIVALIRLDSPGPVLLLQRQIGFDGRPFHICKLRTMTTLENSASSSRPSPPGSALNKMGWLAGQ